MECATFDEAGALARWGSTKSAAWQENCRHLWRITKSPSAPIRPGSWSAPKKHYGLASNEGRIVYQNIVLALLEVAGTGCSTSQCSTILPSASKRKMSTPAVS